MTDEMASRLSEYLSSAGRTALPDDVREATVLHILDTVAAAVSGATLRPGCLAHKYVEERGGPGDAVVYGTGIRAPVEYAAFANAIAAHADETDDSHGFSKTHPGCSIVPTAMAFAERLRSSGTALVRAVALGYDLCGRFPRALWPDSSDEARAYSTHACGGLFGSAAAAASLLGLSSDECRAVLGYSAHQMSGIRTYFREGDHTEKAFVFGGMPAMNGAVIALLAGSGWPSSTDPFRGSPSLMDVGRDPKPHLLTEDLAIRYEVTRTKFKKYPAGSPVQSPVAGLLGLLEQHDLGAADVRRVTVTMTPGRRRTVFGRPMPNLNIEYLLSVALDDGALSFKAAHDDARFGDWKQRGGDERIVVLGSDDLPTSHAAHVTLELIDGTVVAHLVDAIPGSEANPLSGAEIQDKALALLSPVIGVAAGQDLVSGLLAIDELDDLSEIWKVLGTERRETELAGV